MNLDIIFMKLINVSSSIKLLNIEKIGAKGANKI